MRESTTCPACGEVLPARAVFCRTCGFRLQSEEQPMPEEPQQGLDPEEQEAPTELQPDESALPEEAVNDSALLVENRPLEDASTAPAEHLDTAPEDDDTAPTDVNVLPTRAATPARSRAPGAWKAPPPKKRRTGLLLLISALLLVLIAGGVTGVVVLNQKHLLASKPPAATSTPRPTFTPTPNRTRGFVQFSNQKYSLLYPGGWAALPAQSLSKEDEEFLYSPQEVFQVQVIAQASGQPSPKSLDDVACQIVFGPKNTPDAPTMVSIANQQWTRETCEGTPNGTAMQMVAESVVYQNQVFTIFYKAPATSFASDQQQYFTPMEQSFAFLM